MEAGPVWVVQARWHSLDGRESDCTLAFEPFQGNLQMISLMPAIPKAHGQQGNCNDLGIYPAICATSNLWYLVVMGYAQQALQFLPPGGNAYLSPTYPPSDPSVAAQFLRVMTAVGTGIGNLAAHETGHQLALPEMDCSNGLNSACSEDYIYQNGNSSGVANDWFYGTVPGEKIHWTFDAQCKIYKFLGMKNTGCPN
jgi:hypothetical protein